MVWENGFTQVVDSPTRGEALLDVYLVRPESSFTSSSIVQGVSDHYGVLLEVELEGNYCVPHVERCLPFYHKTDVSGLQTFLRENFAAWARYGSCVEEICGNFKGLVHESVERFVPHKLLKKTRTPNNITRKLND